MEVKLLELFRNFDIGMKKIESLSYDKATDVKIQQNVKYALVLFLQENVMRFRSIQTVCVWEIFLKSYIKYFTSLATAWNSCKGSRGW